MSQSPNATRFSSKLAMILTCMGMAVGTGNIWRFPREVASNGGGSFLIPWIIFLGLWSVPLLMVELSVGQNTRKGPFGAFAKLAGPNFAWMGGFVSLCAMLIMCYYAVVTGWTLRYLFYAISGTLNGIEYEQAITLFDDFRNTGSAVGMFFLAIGLTALIVWRGAKGIERLNKILIPTLIVILIIGAISALRLEGSGEGIAFLFSVEGERLGNASHWIAGLTQSAWSTGAGWGLMLAYAVYARDQEDPLTTPMATGLGNNSIEFIVALLIFPAVFAILGVTEAVTFVSGTSSKGGIAFQAIPMLFSNMPGGLVLNILFFLGLAFAALTSLVAMVELSTRFFMDFKLPRGRALAVTIGLCLVVGTPSALSDQIFDNQDYVWGVGLILSGIFLAFLVVRYGVNKFCEDFLNPNAGRVKAGLWFKALICFVLLEGVILLGWWLYQMGSQEFKPDSNSHILTSCLIQWAVVIGALIAFRKPLYKQMMDEG